MEEVLDIEKNKQTQPQKTLAVVGIFLVITLILFHFVSFIITSSNQDLPWIPVYATKFSLRVSFINGAIISGGLLFNFFLFITKRYTTSAALILVLIIIYILFPTLYYSL